MAHHQPKWRASRGAPLSPAHPFTALGGFSLPPDIAVLGAPGPSGSIKLAAAAFDLHPAAARRYRSVAVNLNTDCSAPGDMVDTVLATALREGGPAYSGTASRKNCGITRHRRAQPS